MARIERVTRLGAPVQEVFSFVADFRSLTAYNPSVRSVRPLTPGPPGRGSRYELSLSMLGTRIWPVLTITEFIENERIETRLDAFIPAGETRLFRPHGDATELFFSIEFASGWPLVGSLVDHVLARVFAAPQADTEIQGLGARFGS